ncbi:prephenate dehydrogenase [Amphibacillus marinus]|uniref:Prephenate dehydrogenase n=1 Tax=Amphibacillus marinus TaxID=872970 RepID=A0A1H8GH16_9BACI|nr:prephenate dehydrogenase [Amphibacillus marinus]SEN43044.1 prephenate dehydrogenase [Amphibacillus marinus]
MKQTVLIAGLGLIGGSLAANIKQNKSVHLIGFDLDQQTLTYAKANQIVDETSNDFVQAIKKADFCILAAPVSQTIALIKTIETIDLNHSLIVSDVSSVKGNVMEEADKIVSEQISFIGGHPMAGSHKKGIEAAKAHLFENAFYILTPSKRASEADTEKLKALLSATKSTFIVLNAKEHDEMTSVISHFPHLIASALVQQAKSWEKKHPRIPGLAAGGFRDITRIASSNPGMWQDIFFQNKDILIPLITDWITEMDTLKTLLETNDKISIYHYLEQAREFRDGLDREKRGAIPAFYDVFVDIFDQPGAIKQVISLLADHAISIKNIEILEIREDITGVLRLSFVTRADQLKSQQLLSNSGYETTIED